MAFMTDLVRGASASGGRAPIAEVASTRSASGAPSLALPVLGAMPSATGMLVSQATAMGVSTVRQCVALRAGALARCAPRIVPRGRRLVGSSIADPVVDRLFARPNRVQPWYNFAEFVGASLLLRSNAYIVKLRNALGEIIELVPVNPDLVQVLEAPGGMLFYSISRLGLWMASVLDDLPISVPDYDVIHIRDLAFNLLVGASRLATGRDTVGLAIAQEQQSARWMGNGARPAGVLTTDKSLSQEAAARLAANWNQLNAGVQNTGRTAVLEEGLKWQQISMNADVLEFLKSREFQVREICRLFDVMPHMVGEPVALAKASIAELNADWVNRVVMSDVTRVEQMMSIGLEIGDDFEVMLDERELLRGDLAMQMTIARQGFLSGLVTQNEGRHMIGLPRIDKPEADELHPPVNLAPHGSAIDGTGADGAGKPAEEQT